MYYKVFLDTNIYEGMQFSFNTELFNSLRNYASQGILNLQINSVIVREVRSHIRKRLSEAISSVNKKLNDSIFAGFKNNPKFTSLIPKSDIWIEDALSCFDFFSMIWVRKVLYWKKSVMKYGSWRVLRRYIDYKFHKLKRLTDK